MCVLYLFIFAICSKFKSKFAIPVNNSAKQHKYLVIFPAYKEDNVIVKSVSSFFQQDYPNYLYDVIVVSDQMSNETNSRLAELGAQVLIAQYEDSSKAKALQLAMDKIPQNEYDAVVIMDADNKTVTNFLSIANAYFANGYNFIQAHRTSKDLITDIALLDAVSEEINNGFFRSGHNAVGLSSALSGSGMILNEKIFRTYVYQLNTSGEDKELEALILKNQKGPIVYLDQLPVYDDKVQKRKAISNQRKRWIAAQYGALMKALPDLFSSFRNGNIDYCDKIFQWMLPPRLVQLSLVFLLTLMVALINFDASIKWIVLSAVQIAAMFIPVPSQFLNSRMFLAMVHIPILAFNMILNLFKLKGANKKFIHTEHN